MGSGKVSPENLVGSVFPPAAIFASSASVLAATMINFELNSELSVSGAL